MPDFNGDNNSDFADLGILLSSFNKSKNFTFGDITGNGYVDQADLDM